MEEVFNKLQATFALLPLQNFGKSVAGLADFLGKQLSPQQLTSIVKCCGFDSMKNNENTNQMWLGQLYSKDLGMVKLIRTGWYTAVH